MPDYTKDPDFMLASPEEQHKYLMDVDPEYRGAPPKEQVAYRQFLRSQARQVGPELRAAPSTAERLIRTVPGTVGLLIGSATGNPAAAGLGYAVGQEVAR